MRASRHFISTIKEPPSEAELVSHRLMIRAGMVRRLAAGIYTWMPVGLRVVRKIEAIVREEMNRAGAVREIYRLLKESRQASTEPAPKDGIDIRPIGYTANRRNFEVAAEYAWQQRIIPKQLKLEDLFDATTRALD